MELYDLIMSGRQLKKLAEKEMESLIEQSGLRFVEVDMLLFLSEQKNIDTAKEIMRERKLSKAHVSKSLDNLKSKGYIKVCEDAKDHRVFHISLEEKADELVKSADRIYAHCRERVQAGISKEEMDVVKHVFYKMMENIDQELKK